MRGHNTGTAHLPHIIICAALAGAAAVGAAAFSAEAKAALRCWRCGDVFTVDAGACEGRCPSCRAAFRRNSSGATLALHCIGSGGGRFVYLLKGPDNAVVVYSMGEEGAVGAPAEYLREIGVTEIELLVGGEASEECMRSLLTFTTGFRVKHLYDPGFRNEGALYPVFLREIQKADVKYHVIRAVENTTAGATRIYLARSDSLQGGVGSDKIVSMCAIHGANLFSLTRGLRGKSMAPLREHHPQCFPPLLMKGGAVSAGAVGSPGTAVESIVLESDGRSIGVRSLRHVEICAAAAASGGTAEGIPPVGAARAPKSAPGPAGKVNLNTASLSELDTLSGIGAKKAAMIVEFREANGGFRRIEELKKVPGIGEKLFQRNKDRLCVK